MEMAKFLYSTFTIVFKQQSISIHYQKHEKCEKTFEIDFPHKIFYFRAQFVCALIRNMSNGYSQLSSRSLRILELCSDNQLLMRMRARENNRKIGCYIRSMTTKMMSAMHEPWISVFDIFTMRFLQCNKTIFFWHLKK